MTKQTKTNETLLLFLFLLLLCRFILEIQQKLETLAVDETDLLPLSSKQSINRILNELKDQERINEAALEILKKRILKDSLGAKSPITKTSAVPTYMSNSNANFNPNASIQPKRTPILSDSFSRPQQYQTTSQYSSAHHQAPATSYLSKPYPMLDDSLSHEEIRFVKILFFTSKH